MAFLILIAVVLVIAAIVGIVVVRPAWKRIERACDKVDEMHTIQASERRQAETELDGPSTEELRQQ